MGIYLGANALGGGGGGTPVGGFAFFTPPATESFTEGQEVYTDPDNMVWLRSGAEIYESGPGSLDANEYPLVKKTAIGSVAKAERYSTEGQVRDNRWGIGFSGKHILVKGYNGGYNDYALFDPDGTKLEGFIQTTLTSASTTMFHNNTHTFIGTPSGSNFGNASGSAPSWKYMLTSSLTDYASYEAAGIKTFASPESSYAYIGAVTNPGGAAERHWFYRSDTIRIYEYTFDSTVAGGSNPWTPTNNFISPPVAGVSYPQGHIVGHGNLLYFQYNNNLKTYNATTRELISDITITPWAQHGSALGYGFFIIPASLTSSGLAEYCFPKITSSPASTYTSIPTEIFNYGNIVSAPNVSGTPIFLTHQKEATTLDVDNVTTTSSDKVYLWQRIA